MAVILFRPQPVKKGIDGLVQDCSISSVVTMEILQSCTKSLIYFHIQTIPRHWFKSQLLKATRREDEPVLLNLLCIGYWVFIDIISSLHNFKHLIQLLKFTPKEVNITMTP